MTKVDGPVDTYVINVESCGFDSGNKATIKINDQIMEINENENKHHRGLHIILINGEDGTIDHAKAYDTYESSRKLEEFIDSPLARTKGHIVVAACKDECSQQLSHKVEDWFISMGAEEIVNLYYRLSYVFIGILGSTGDAAEKRGIHPTQFVSV